MTELERTLTTMAYGWSTALAKGVVVEDGTGERSRPSDAMRLQLFWILTEAGVSAEEVRELLNLAQVQE